MQTMNVVISPFLLTIVHITQTYHLIKSSHLQSWKSMGTHLEKLKSREIESVNISLYFGHKGRLQTYALMSQFY